MIYPSCPALGKAGGSRRHFTDLSKADQGWIRSNHGCRSNGEPTEGSLNLSYKKQHKMNSSKHLLNPVTRRPDLLYNRIRRRVRDGKTMFYHSYDLVIDQIVELYEPRENFSSFLSPRKTK